MYKECIDACFDAVKAAERCGYQCADTKECPNHKSCCAACAEICMLVGRLTARGICTKDFYELCTKICDDCANICGKMDHECAQTCAAAAKRCAEACRKCQEDCGKCS